MIYVVYRCQRCFELIELPEEEVRQKKPACPFCSSEDVEKIFTHNKCKPSPFS